MVRRKHPWSVLSSHGLVLAAVARLGNITVPEIAEKTGLSRSTVLHALKDLRSARMIKVRRSGRRNEYDLQETATFRHPIMHDVQIGPLVRSLTRKAMAFI